MFEKEIETAGKKRGENPKQDCSFFGIGRNIIGHCNGDADGDGGADG